MEFKRPTGDFNLNALPSEEKWRKLMYFATSGSDVIHTPFATIINGETIQEKRRREDREAFERFVGALASRERIAEFSQKLDRYEHAAATALAENEAKLRVARKEMQQIQDRAYELTRPDGSAAKVYRDGSVVRYDDGAIVDSQLIKPDDISSAFPTYAERVVAQTRIDDLMRRNQEIREYQGAVERGRKLVESGRATEEDLDALEKELSKVPEDVRSHLPDDRRAHVQDGAPPADPGSNRSGLSASSRPTADFLNVAALELNDMPDADFRPRKPGASMPSPK